MMDMDLFQDRFGTYTQGAFDEYLQVETYSTIEKNTGAAEHYYWDFNSVFDNLSGYYPCLVNSGDTTATPKYGQTLPRNEEFTINDPNPSICN